MDKDELLDDDFYDARFRADEEVMVARIFLDANQAEMAVSLLRVEKIPHFLSNRNATLYENVLDGQRLFIRKKDREIVAELLDGLSPDPMAKEEDWYKAVRNQQTLSNIQRLTLVFLGLLALAVTLALLFLLWW